MANAWREMSQMSQIWSQTTRGVGLWNLRNGNAAAHLLTSIILCCMELARVLKIVPGGFWAAHRARAIRVRRGPLGGGDTHKLRAHEHPRLALNGVAPRLVLGHLRVLRVRLLSIVYCKKTSAARGNTKRTPPRTRRGQLTGTRYPRQANRGTGLGRGDPSADGASGLQGLTFKKCLSRV